MTELLDPGRRAQVGALKRIFEFWTMDADFHDRYLVDPSSALAKTGLDVDPNAVSLLLLRVLPKEAAGWEDADNLPETFNWYRDYVESRVRRNALARAHELPVDPRFRDWVLRQERRCDREMGARGRLIGHLPVAFELSSGCSGSCPFCALSAEKLRGVFHYTYENAALWRDVLASAHAVVGEAAGRGFCYYATEPLDNPDYERFLADFHAEFGRVPQTTTAAATRNIERTRRLLRWGQQAHEHFDRISVLSKRDFDTLIASFSPEELIFTDLLPQFAEAPACSLVKAGRNRGVDQGVEGTIACVSGFVVNMWERSLRLVTPAAASAEHPTGELVYETVSFTDGASFEQVLRGMSERHMHETIGLEDVLGGLKRAK